MPKSKNNMPMILFAVAFVILAAAGMIYFSKNMKKDGAPAEVAAASETQTAPAAGSNNTGEPPATAEEEQEVTKAATEGFNGVEVKPGNPVVAKVDGNDITRVDVFRFIKMMPANIQQMPPQAVYPMAVEQVINTRLVQNKAEAANMENDPEVQEQMNMARQQIIRSIYVQREIDKQISDSDLKKKYEETVGAQPDVKEARAAHILVDSEAKAKEIIAKVQSGEDFAKLASENSSDPGNKDKGGELGWFAQGDMVPEFSEAVFKMKKGDVSKEPVKTQFGWHVVKLEDLRNRPKPTFDETKEMLKTELRREKLEAMLQNWRQTAKIEKFDINGDPEKAQSDVAPAAGEAPAPETAPAQ